MSQTELVFYVLFGRQVCARLTLTVGVIYLVINREGSEDNYDVIVIV